MRKLALQGRLDRPLPLLRSTRIAGTARQGFSTISTTRLRRTSSGLTVCQWALVLIPLKRHQVLVRVRAVLGQRHVLDLERRRPKLLCLVARRRTKHTRSYLARRAWGQKHLCPLQSTRIAEIVRQGFSTTSTRRPRRTSSGLTACRVAFRFPQLKCRQLLLRVRAARAHPLRCQVDLEPKLLCRVARRRTEHSTRNLAVGR